MAQINYVCMESTYEFNIIHHFLIPIIVCNQHVSLAQSQYFYIHHAMYMNIYGKQAKIVNIVQRERASTCGEIINKINIYTKISF